MSKRRKILVIAGASAAALLAVLIVTCLVIVRTSWFANFVREKIIATVQESTGGNVELKSFEFDPGHLTVRIRGFVLHGREPRSAAPLARIVLLEVHLKLFSGIAHAVDLAYVGVQQPQVNLIVFPDGTTNMPNPKVKSASNNGNALQTIVNLKIGEFTVQNGLLTYAQQKSEFSGRGENLHALLNYSAASPSYSGRLSIAPLILVLSGREPLKVNVDLPVAIDGNAIRLTDAKLYTPQSKIAVTASLEHLNEPIIDGTMDAALSLAELQHSFGLPLNTTSQGVPQMITAQLSAHLDQSDRLIDVRNARVGLGDTVFQASGKLRDPGNSKSTVSFRGNFSLGQLSRLLNSSGFRVDGTVVANGDAILDAQNNYQVNGSLNGRGLSAKGAGTDISGVNVSTPFHADPSLVSVDGLAADVLGGSLRAKVFLKEMRNLTVAANLRDFSVAGLATALTGGRLGYDGTLSGAVTAHGDLKTTRGVRGITADANLGIAPGNRGVPLSGRIAAKYLGAANSIDLTNSYIAFPNSRIDVAGDLNQRVDLNLVSRNLNDFLPAVNFKAAHPQTSLPMTLEPNGTATVSAAVTETLGDPNISAHVAVNKFQVEQRPFDVLALDAAASPAAVSIQNGTLSHGTLRTSFQGSLGLRKWAPTPVSPLHVDLGMRDASLADLLSLAGQGSIPATGAATADIHINGTYGDPLGSAVLQIANGTAYQQPFSSLRGQVNLTDQLISLTPLEIVADAGTIQVSATYRHPRDSFMIGDAQMSLEAPTIQLAKLKQLQQQAPETSGTVQLTASAAASIRKVNNQTVFDVSDVSADLNARAMKVRNQDAGDLMLTARTRNKLVTYRVTSNFGGSQIALNGRTTLANNYPTTADAVIQNLAVHKVLAAVDQSTVPASGILSANAHVSGALNSPQGSLTFALADANIYQEKIDRLSGSVQYSDRLVDVPSIELKTPAGSLTLAASFSHPLGDFARGTVKVKANAASIELAKIQHVRQQQPTLSGALRLALDLSADVGQRKGNFPVLVKQLNANLATSGLNLQQRDLGNANLTAETTGSTLNFRFDSDIAQSRIHANGRSQLTGSYPTNATLTFGNIKYSNFAPYIAMDPSVQAAFDATVEGAASLDGSILDADSLTGRLQLTKLEARTSPNLSPTSGVPRRSRGVANQGPIIVLLKRSVLDVQQFKMTGDGTNLTVSGSAGLKDKSAPINVRLGADLDLGALQDVDREFYSSGTVGVNAVVRGTWAQPLMNGRLELKNANVNYAESPNGLSNANGVILLTGTGASIQNLTGETGGGKISVTGFAGFSGQAITYNVKAAASKVRVRYSGVSVTSDSNITLTGNTERSLLAGNVMVTRITYNSSSDAGSLLSSFASKPPSGTSAPSATLTGMRLNIHVLTAPDLRVVTTYADRLSVEANLTVRGTVASPGMVGRVTITEGQLVFFGNTYTVNTGTINFYDANSIQPIINVSLETVAQGIDVTLGVSGPMNNLQLTYTSDPPLSFEQIVELLATNTTPNDPNTVANQPQGPQQSFTQMGESAILGQAVANPLASRVQRVFGLSQFKIDPSIAGSNGPSARVTLQQKIANNITFTYITDVTQTNSEIVRVQWDLTPKFSGVGLRDFNGNVSLEFFYRFKAQ